MNKIPSWIWTALVLLLVFGVPRVLKQNNHDKMIEAAHESCRLLKSDKSITQREALMAGIIASGVDLKSKSNSTQQTVLEYGFILKKCGFKLE